MSNLKPVTFNHDETEDISRSNKFNSFIDLFGDLKWTKNYLFLCFIIGPILFLVWLLRDTCLNYGKQNKTGKKRKTRHRKKRKRHRRLIEDGE